MAGFRKTLLLLVLLVVYLILKVPYIVLVKESNSSHAFVERTLSNLNK
jgi:hypothetical protein